MDRFTRTSLAIIIALASAIVLLGDVVCAANQPAATQPAPTTGDAAQTLSIEYSAWLKSITVTGDRLDYLYYTLKPGLLPAKGTDAYDLHPFKMQLTPAQARRFAKWVEDHKIFTLPREFKRRESEAQDTPTVLRVRQGDSVYHVKPMAGTYVIPAEVKAAIDSLDALCQEVVKEAAATQPASTAPSNDLGVEAVLTRCEQSQAWIRNASFKGETFSEQLGPLWLQNSRRMTLRFDYCRDGDLMKLSAAITHDERLSPGEPLPPDMRDAFVQTRDFGIEYASKVHDDPAFAVAWPGRNRCATRLGMEQYHGPLSGVPTGCNAKTLTDILRGSKDVRISGMDRVGEDLCYVIEGVSEYGHTKAWISPAKGFTFLKYTHTKTASDIFDDKPLSHCRWCDTPGKEYAGLTASLDGVTVQKIGNIYVPIGGRWITTDTLRNGEVSSMRFTYKRSDIVLQPKVDASAAFRVDLPDGTRILGFQRAGELGVRREWRNGQIVEILEDPAVNDVMSRLLPGGLGSGATTRPSVPPGGGRVGPSE